MTLEIALPLDNPEWEAFAQGCAQALSPLVAAKEAGYAKPGPAARRLLARDKVVQRINAIVERRGRGGSSDVSALVDRLIDLADEAARSSDAGKARTLEVARACLADAGRLKPLILPEPGPVRRPMPLAEWRERFDPTWPGRKAAAEAEGEAEADY